ncbi:unnamed protein product [Rhizoctonia solani]|uniref:Enoyl reductase (ER) domain-containing protein n=1 Tax=Rhizoctonia solani TaxID=456999 RepID=A0A8H3HLT9_9AGAM|nr:unnamed protein product [Rhizoctonia solani]
MLAISYWSDKVGSSVDFNFEGEAVYLHGHLYSSHGLFKVALDSQEAVALNGSSRALYTQALLYYADGLGPGTHVLKVTNSENKVLGIDFADVRKSGSDSSNLASKPRTKEIAIGSAFGVLGILLSVIAIWYFRRRRRTRRCETVDLINPLVTHFGGPPPGYEPMYAGSGWHSQVPIPQPNPDRPVVVSRKMQTLLATVPQEPNPSPNQDDRPGNLQTETTSDEWSTIMGGTNRPVMGEVQPQESHQAVYDRSISASSGTMPPLYLRKMRAVLVKNNGESADDLYIGERPKPEPDSKEVLVKVVAFGVNRMDLMQRKGGYPLPPGASDILGVEFSGTIEEVGSEVSGWEVGQEVIGLATGGAYAEYITLPAGNIMSKPKCLSWVEAAAIPENFITAFQALIFISELKSGEDVLVHAGAGGVGVAANQLAALYGAKHVITTASSKEKLEFLHEMPKGSTHGINYREQNFAEEVAKITDGRGVDVILDFIGPDYWEKNVEALARDGRMVILASMSGNEVPKVNLIKLLYKRLRIQGTTLRSRSSEYQAALIKRFWDECGSHFHGEELKIYIHKTYKWTEVSEAHKEMEANKTMGKIIVEIS